VRLSSGLWGHATTENGLHRLGREFGFRSTAYIYPVEPRKEPNLSYHLLRAIYPLFGCCSPTKVIRADDLARAMVDAAVHSMGSSLEPAGKRRNGRKNEARQTFGV